MDLNLIIITVNANKCNFRCSLHRKHFSCFLFFKKRSFRIKLRQQSTFKCTICGCLCFVFPIITSVQYCFGTPTCNIQCYMLVLSTNQYTVPKRKSYYHFSEILFTSQFISQLMSDEKRWKKPQS